MRKIRMTRGILLGFLLLAAHALPGCDRKPVAGSAPAPPSVAVARPLQKTITEWDEYTGRFTAVASIEVRAAAQVASLEAAFNQAELNLAWTEVRAPISGRISDKRVDAGNLITGGQTGATLLTVIVSMDPIHFVFGGSEADFLHYLRLATAG